MDILRSRKEREREEEEDEEVEEEEFGTRIRTSLLLNVPRGPRLGLLQFAKLRSLRDQRLSRLKLKRAASH